jgi:hyperosmotically inducible periplasmic protein
MRSTIVVLLALAALGCSGQKSAEGEAPPDKGAPPAADNTEKNERDRSGTALTATDQSESEADRSISQKARQGVVANDELSTDGKNVKIITVDGVVTLRGPVTSAQERASIAKIVQQVDGVKKIDNQLEVAAK